MYKQYHSDKKINPYYFLVRVYSKYGTPTGIRTPVAAVKGQCPRPLDDGRVTEARTIQKAFSSVNAFTAFLKILPISVCYFRCIMPVLIKRKIRHVV